MRILSNINPTYNFIFKLIDPELGPHFNLEEMKGSLTITPGYTFDDILEGIPKFAKADIIAVQNGAMITVESTEIIPRLIANNGVINVDNKFPTAEKTDIA
ncbi:MAG: hypothetical protein NWP47_01550, partial [Rickettsiaceae bacterium]|nr:hypothetical protein [Rickettsiaceae bacterium]